MGENKCPPAEKLVLKARDLEPGKMEVKCLK
jgi:hypothetical protein